MRSPICKRPGMLSSEWNQPKPLRLDHRDNLREGAPPPAETGHPSGLGEFLRTKLEIRLVLAVTNANGPSTDLTLQAAVECQGMSTKLSCNETLCAEHKKSS